MAGKVRKHLKNHFIPHAGNNHHPYVLRHGALLVYSFFLIALKVVAVVAPLALPANSLYSSAITLKNVADLTNAARSTAGLAPLILNDRLIQAAQAKAEDMLQNQYFAHQSPTGRMPWNWIRETGYDYSYAGENLAVHFLEAEDVQAGWLASPSHRANIVNTHYLETGIGIASGQFEGSPSIMVVQLFGTPIAEPLDVPTTPTLLATASDASDSTDASDASLSPNASPPSPPNILGVSEPAEQPEPVTVPTQPTATQPTTELKPTKDGLEVTVTTKNAKLVSAQLGTDTTPLTRSTTKPDEWTGQVPINPHTSSPHGEALTVTVQGNNGKTTQEPVSLVAAAAQPSDVFYFNDNGTRKLKLFRWINVSGLQDAVRRTYVYFIVFLAAALLISVFVKIKVQHPSVVVHSLAVIGLASVLLFL